MENIVKTTILKSVDEETKEALKQLAIELDCEPNGDIIKYNGRLYLVDILGDKYKECIDVCE